MIIFGYYTCRFAREQVEQLDKNKQWSRALDGSDYLPGMVLILGLTTFLFYCWRFYMILNGTFWNVNHDFGKFQVGLNNIKETDFVNVTIQSLMRVTPLRNFFLIPENYKHSKSPLVHRFGELTRKIWHTRNFKGQVCSQSLSHWVNGSWTWNSYLSKFLMSYR